MRNKVIKNQRASRYKRCWLNAAATATQLDLKIKLLTATLKASRESLTKDEVKNILKRRVALRLELKQAHKQCKKYKIEFKINNE